jgi:hypothetical protein
MNINELYKNAQLMRNRVEEYESDYIEKYLDEKIVALLWENGEWWDDEGFYWSFACVSASKDENGIYISYANKYLGMGHHESKVYRPESKKHEIISI